MKMEQQLPCAVDCSMSKLCFTVARRLKVTPCLHTNLYGSLCLRFFIGRLRFDGHCTLEKQTHICYQRSLEMHRRGVFPFWLVSCAASA